MRSLKAQTYRYGNKAGKSLAQQLKEKNIKQKISYLINPKSNKKVNNPQEIADAFSDYYEKLYNLKRDPDTFQPNDTVISEFLESIHLPKISPEDLAYINQPFTLQETTDAIKRLPRNKAPGPDGYSSEYYQLLSPIRTSHLLPVFESATTTAKFPPEMLTATIITLPKPGKEPNLPQNFQPISLLNVDVKFHAKLIANRLSRILPNLINYDQVGFVMGRQTTDATRRMLNLLHLVEENKEPSLLLALDAEKAFDRVHWGYLSKVMDKFGLVGPLQNAIMALYSSPSAFVYTEGLFSKPFLITNGTRQGCPLSPIIFTMLMEPLAEKIRSHPSIHGIKSQEHHHKISLFADDVILALSNPDKSLPTAHDVLAQFSKISYYKVNASKSSILGIHIHKKLENHLKHSLPYPWTNESINYLGIKLTYPVSKTYTINYTPLLSSFQPELSRLGKHHLTWLGRLAAYKMLILPKLIYIFRVLPIPAPASFFRSMQKQLSNFVWAGKRPRCSPEIQTKNKTAGGMGLPILKDYHTAAVLDQLKNWFSNPITKPWCHLETVRLNKTSPLSFLIANKAHKQNKRPLPQTIQAILQSWEEINITGNEFYPSTMIPIPLNTLQWTIPNINLRNWYKANILNIMDIMCGNKLLPFSTIQQKFNLSTSEFLAYTQITSYLQEAKATHVSIVEKVWTFLQSKNPNIKGIKMIYNYLHSKDAFTKNNKISKWEKEIGKEFTDLQWKQAINNNRKFSRCANYEELTQKLMLRWYYTPYITAKFSRDNSNLCWRGCGQIGTLAHMLWSCLGVKKFWWKVYDMLSKLTNSTVVQNIEQAILGLNMDQYKPEHRCIVTQILLAARMELIYRWKSIDVPTIKDIKIKINTIIEYE